MATYSRLGSIAWWKRHGDDVINLVGAAAVVVGSFWGIYVELALPANAPIAFAVGFMGVMGWIIRLWFCSPRPNDAGMKPLGSRLGAAAFFFFLALLLASWGGGLLALVAIAAVDGGIDCAPGIPMRYC